MRDAEIRSFVAIELPAGLKERLKAYQAALKLPQHRFVKWVDPGLIHLTIKFLGNVSSGKLDDVKSALAKAAGATRPFKLQTKETGCFPNPKRVRVFWLGMKCDGEELLKLAKDVDVALTRLGFPGEDRPFASHLTLAMLRDGCSQEDRAAFGELIKGSEFQPQFSLQVESLSLMRSQLTPSGPIYTCLAKFKLGGV